MPKVNRVEDDTPEKLKPYTFHGVEFSWSQTSKNAKAECPFCGSGRFQVLIETGKGQCFSCHTAMNGVGFLQKLHEASTNLIPDLTELSVHRKIDISTLKAWMVTRSMIDGNWLIPGWNPNGKICQLYSYRMIRGKYTLRVTTTLRHQLFGLNLWEPTRDFVFIAEGPWDGMKLWEVLGNRELKEDILVYTDDIEKSLLSNANVIAVPSATVFSESWLPLFRGKTVNLWYDNDYPKTSKKTGNRVSPVGYGGMKRVAGYLSKVTQDINFLSWGPEGFSEALKNKLDIRDMFILDDKGILANA